MTLSRVGQPYSQKELKQISVLAENQTRVTGEMLDELFPGRTRASVRLMLCKERKRIGVAQARQCKPKEDQSNPIMLDPDDPGVPNLWIAKQTKKMRESNEQFLAALAAA